MLFFGYLYPKQGDTHFTYDPKVDLTPWRYGWAASATMFSGIVALYLLFSPVGLVDGLSNAFWIYLMIIVLVNAVVCFWSIKRYDKKQSA
jgi:SSS family solute:Na+ symporter